MKLLEKIKRVAKKLTKFAQPEESPLAHQPEEESVELGETPSEILEEDQRKREQREEEKDKPSVVVQGDAAPDDVDEAALQYTIELVEGGKPIDDAITLTKDVFYKESAVDALWANFCKELRATIGGGVQSNTK